MLFTKKYKGLKMLESKNITLNELFPKPGTNNLSSPLTHNGTLTISSFDGISCTKNTVPFAEGKAILQKTVSGLDPTWKYNPWTGEPLVEGWPLYSGLPVGSEASSKPVNNTSANPEIQPKEGWTPYSKPPTISGIYKLRKKTMGLDLNQVPKSYWGPIFFGFWNEEKKAFLPMQYNSEVGKWVVDSSGGPLKMLSFDEWSV